MDVIENLLTRTRLGESVALCTVVAVSGSTPRGPGTSMLVAGDGSVVGSISGGCVESAVYELALEVLSSGEPRLVSYGAGDESVFAVGLLCGGTIDVFVERVGPSNVTEFEFAVKAADRGETAVLATLISAGEPARSGGGPGGHLVIADRSVKGSLGVGSLDEVVVLLAPSAHDKGLELTLDVHNDVPEQVIGDSLRLQQIITNLLGNAIKFTETGNIDIRVELRKQLDRRVEVEVQIHDTGIGISERQQSQLFQAFRQADASISRRHGGTGLGLVITQKLVKEMGGDICFHSQLNRGSTFWFHITLDLNEGMLSLAPSLPDLNGKTLAYIESNPTAAQATLNMLSVTQLVITHSPTLGQLPSGHYDFLLAGVPIYEVYTGDGEGEVRYGRGSGPWFDSATDFAALQLRYEVVYAWHALAEYRWLDVQAGGTRQGWLVGLDRDIGKNFRIGAGYNFTEFSDDLTDFDYDHEGWFLNMVGMY